MSNCQVCKLEGEFYKWAYFDKKGDLVRGECVHGVVHDDSEAEEINVDRDVLEGFKVYLDAGGVV